MQGDPELLFTNNVFLFHLTNKRFLLEAPKTLKPFFWGFGKDLGIIVKKAVL
jgi:hypothetical protein